MRLLAAVGFISLMLTYSSEVPCRDQVLGKAEPDKSKKIIARKPNVAFYAGLEALMFPEHVRSVAERVDFCREHDVDYILYSGIEISLRPHVKDLLKINQNIPGLEKVYHNRFGVIYRVLEK